MRIWPRSLFGRLLMVASATTIAAIAFSAFTIGHVLERFVTRGMDQQLDAQIAVLVRAVGPDARPDPTRAVSLPAFEDPGSGWGWRIDGPAGHWAQGEPFEPDADPWRDPPGHGRHGDRPDPKQPSPGEGDGQSGERVHFRRLSIATASGPVLITAAGPRRVAERPLREAMTPLLVSLGLLGCALAAATLLQLSFGLRPLRRLRLDLAAVREGRARHIPMDQPSEITPLAEELNGLIDQNEEGLAHARRHVSNLAHGMKTPLAALALRLQEPGRDPDGELGAMIAQIDRRLRHHLGRARAAVPGGSNRLRTEIAPAISDLILALRRIHADRPVEATFTIPAGIAVAVDPQDLDEMVGNLLDNAWRHARSSIHIEVSRDGATVMLDIQDDGPGLPSGSVDEALMPGRRLDERGEGHGFGLPISQELAQLNGGELRLGESTILGGLRATLTLPAPVDSSTNPAGDVTPAHEEQKGRG